MITWPETRRADGIDMAIDLCIIGGFVTGEIAVHEETNDHKNDQCDNDCNAKARALCARGSVW